MGNRNYEPRETTLEDLFEEVRDFSLVIPHFQRRFVWDAKEKQRFLLRSMLAGIPIGSILLLEDESKSYASRPLCFPDIPPKIEEGGRCKFLLDGQQRLSTLKSMFCDLFSNDEMSRLEKEGWKELCDALPNQLRNRWFLKIDIDSEEERDIFGFKNLIFEEDNNDPFSPSDFDTHIEYRQIKKTKPYGDYHPDHTDYNSINSYLQLQNYAVSNKLLPLSLLYPKTINTFKTILEQIAKNEHLNADAKGSEQYKEDEAKIEQWAEAVCQFLTKRTFNAKIHSIILKGKAGIAIGIHIFEQVNRGGMPLDVYDLLVARMGHSGKNLTEEIKKIIEVPQDIMQGMEERGEFDVQNMGIWIEKDDIPTKAFKKHFKNCLAVCVEYRKNEILSSETVKEKTILSLSVDDIKDNWEETVKILLSVLQFLQFRCGIIEIKDIPYDLLIVPLFVFFISHNNTPRKEDIDRIEFWYWASIFAGYYEKKQNVQIIKDSNRIIKKEGFKDRLEKILKKPGYSDQKSLTTAENSGATPLSKVFPQYVLSTRPLDLIDGNKTVVLTARDFAEGKYKKHEHHIILVDQIAKDEDIEAKALRQKSEHPVNSPINKVYISDKANLKIKDIHEYGHNKKALNCEKNISPDPIKPIYIREENGRTIAECKKYNLEKFLSDRFEMLEKHIKIHLKSLI